MKEAKRKVDALNGHVAIALVSEASNVGIVEREVSDLFHGPVGEHDP